MLNLKDLPELVVLFKQERGTFVDERIGRRSSASLQREPKTMTDPED